MIEEKKNVWFFFCWPSENGLLIWRAVAQQRALALGHHNELGRGLSRRPVRACNGYLLRLHFNVLSNHDKFRGQIKMVSWFLFRRFPARSFGRSPCSAVPEFAFCLKIIGGFCDCSSGIS